MNDQQDQGTLTEEELMVLLDGSSLGQAQAKYVRQQVDPIQARLAIASQSFLAASIHQGRVALEDDLDETQRMIAAGSYVRHLRVQFDGDVEVDAIPDFRCTTNDEKLMDIIRTRLLAVYTGESEDDEEQEPHEGL